MRGLLLKFACIAGLPGSARKLSSLRLMNSRARGDQTEVGEQLLLDRALGLAVELLHRQQLLGNLVQFLDAPAAVVQVGEVPHAVALPVQQGGGEGVGGRAGGVLDEAHPAGLEGGLRALAQRVGAGRDGDRVIGAVAEDEVAEQGGGVPLEAEDGLQAAFGVGVQQLEGVVTAVVDDDIAGGERPEVGQLVLVLAAQPVRAAALIQLRLLHLAPH